MEDYCTATVPSDGGPPVVMSYSIGTDRNDLISAWEKSTPLFEQRMRAVEALRAASLFVVVTLSPLGLWNDLAGTLEQCKALGVAYITCLFFKENTLGATTPPRFLDYLREQYPMVLDAQWQAERVEEMRRVYGDNFVLLGKEGFSSLASPLTRRMESDPHDRRQWSA
jgi:DNA repair photolyase